VKGAVDLQLSEPAVRDFERLGRVARRLLSASIRDHVVSLTGLSKLDQDTVRSLVDQNSLPPQLLPHAESGDWYVLPVAGYQVIVKPLLEDGRPGGAIVARVFEKGDLPSMSTPSSSGTTAR
jgi:hypothetical protein